MKSAPRKLRDGCRRSNRADAYPFERPTYSPATTTSAAPGPSGPGELLPSAHELHAVGDGPVVYADDARLAGAHVAAGEAQRAQAL